MKEFNEERNTQREIEKRNKKTVNFALFVLTFEKFFSVYS